MKKKLFGIVLVILIVLFLSLNIKVNCATSYYSYTDPSITVNGSYDININKSNLNTVYKKINNAQSNIALNGRISYPYQVVFYRFKPSTSGYYSFYTTGSTSTVIKCYQRNLLGSSYTDLGSSRTGSMVDENTRNASLVLELKKNKEYIICVRAHRNTVGSFSIYGCGNEDLVLASEYSFIQWRNDTPAINEIYQKTYMDVVNCLFLYLSLYPITREFESWTNYNGNYQDFIRLSKNSPSEARKIFKEVMTEIVDYAVDVGINVALALASEGTLAWADGVGIALSTISFLGNLISLYNNRSYGGEPIYEYLQEVCVISDNLNPASFNDSYGNRPKYQTTNVYLIENGCIFVDTCTALSIGGTYEGMAVKKYEIQYSTKLESNISIYKSGGKYLKGTWRYTSELINEKENYVEKTLVLQ